MFGQICKSDLAVTLSRPPSRAESTCLPMQAVTYAVKMLQMCSSISKCILDGQLSKAQQLLERANSQWQSAGKLAADVLRYCHVFLMPCDVLCL